MLAVTTRNKLKSARFIVPMLVARRRVRQQLRHTRGLIRWADFIASPTEFCTLTLWASKHVMFEFMSSDAHREMLWLFARWSHEFWSMRWLPGTCELGDWRGVRVARLKTQPERRAQTPIPDMALATRAGAGPIDPSACPVTALTALLTIRSPRGLAQLQEVRRWLRAETHAPQSTLVRWVLGTTEPNQYVLVALWRQDAERIMAQVAERVRPTWAMAWQPGDYEIGHWDGLRLRQLARREPLALAA